MKHLFLLAAATTLSLLSANAQSDANTTVIQGAFQEFNSNGGRTGVDFHAPEATIGSPYLFDKWVKGTVVTATDTVVANPGYRFNYNKMTGVLLVTQDQQTYIALDKGSFKAFSLNDPLGNVRSFEMVRAVNPNSFVEVVTKGSKYAIYKLIKTKFKKADYRTDGLTETGDRENQYIDEFEYYVVNVSGKPASAAKFVLKRKSIKEAFGADVAKVEGYFAQHKDDDINDLFVKDLGEYLNQ